MELDVYVGVHPERIRTIAELEDILLKIQKYEEKTGLEAGVVLRQNRHLGGSCRVVSKEKAIEGMNKPRIYEWYVKYWSRSYFEDLREKLKAA